MRRKLVTFIVLFVPVCMSAHEIESLRQAFDNDTLITDQTEQKPELGTMYRVLEEKQREIDLLKDSIAILHNRYKADIGDLQKQSDDALKEQQKDIDSLSNVIVQNKKEQDDLHFQISELESYRKSMEFLDSIIFLQSLIYPLEVHYNAQLIADSKHCLDKLALAKNIKYKGNCAVYRELLDDYAKYNQELLSFLENLQHSYEMKQWKINSIDASGAMMALKNLSYYKFYESRNKKPYKSIIYLDRTIDRFVKILSEPEKINKGDFQGLVDRL